MKQPLLKLIACHRGIAGHGIRQGMKVHPTHYRRIPSGALKGCFHRTFGNDRRSVFRLTRGCVLEFCLVIRVDYP